MGPGVEWFDDEEAIKFSKMDGLLFVSDVRGDDTSEEEIARDMRAQQRWAVLTGSEAYMFKFRVPYRWSKDIEQAYSDMNHMVVAAEIAGKKINLVRHETLKKNKKTEKPSLLLLGMIKTSEKYDEIEYIDGDAYIQLYARPKTAELRLIGKRVGDTYKTRMFKVSEIENKMATFNAFYRSHAQFFSGQSKSVYNKNDVFAGYDQIAEFAIAAQCSELVGKSKTLSAIESTRESISSAINEFIDGKSTPEQCSIKTFNLKNAKSKVSPSRRLLDLVKDCEAHKL